MKTAIQIFIIATLLGCQKNNHQGGDRFQVMRLADQEIPAQIQIQGKILIAQRWEDQNGENILVISRKGPIAELQSDSTMTPDEKYAVIVARHFIKNGNQYTLLSNLTDSVRHCQLDLWAGMVSDSVLVTDLDNDSICETSFVYKCSCRGDITPSNLKVVLFENGQTMKLAGMMALITDSSRVDKEFEYDLSKIDTSGVGKNFEVAFGRFKNTDDFKEKPAVFLDFARKQWVKNVRRDDFIQF